MANLKFARGSTIPTYDTPGFDDGCIYFNTAYKQIYLRNGTSNDSSSVVYFQGTDTKNTAGASTTSSKIYLVGATATGANPQTYCNTKTYAYNGYLYSNSSRVLTGVPYYNSYSSNTTVATANAHFAYIQNVPLYNNSVTSTDGSAAGITWWKMYGQNVISSSNMLESSSNLGFDYAINLNTTRPSLQNAKWIDVAVHSYYLMFNANGGTAIADSNLAFSSSDYPVIRCYRTDASAYADADSQYPDTTGMFVGEMLLANAGTTSASRVCIGGIKLALCCNATNAVHVRVVRHKMDSEGCGSTTASSYSADPGGAYSAYSSMSVALEKFIYPLYIQY